VGVTIGGMDVGGIAVGGMTVGSGFVGTGVDVSAGGRVLVGSGLGVLDGRRVFVGNGLGVLVGRCVLVGRGVGVLVGRCVLVGRRVGVSDGVFVGMETAVRVGSPVPVGAAVAVSPGNVSVSVGVKVIPGRPSWDMLVGCAASTGGSIIKTPTSSMAAPAFSNVILTNRAWMGENCVFMISVCETVPLKPVCAERKTCAYSTKSLLLSPSAYTSERATAITNCPRSLSVEEPGFPF